MRSIPTKAPSADPVEHETSTADRCCPALCALGAEPHAHCPCGLPMPVAARLCDLCQAEDFRPRRLKAADHVDEWDGIRYPSLRRNRPTDAPPDRYDALLRAILGPLPERNTEPATAGEAA